MTKSGTIPFRALVLIGLLSTGQTRASDVQQAAIELTAARYLSSLKPVPAQGFVLDARSYVLAVDIGLDGKRILSEPSSETLASHTMKHLEAIRSELPLAGFTADKDECPASAPTLCRVGDYPGLLSFGAATVDGNRAQLSVTWWAKDDHSRSVTGLKRTTIHLSLELTERAWRVVRAITTIS
jgi:hypothetical protein